MRQLIIYGSRRFREPPLVVWSDGDGYHDLAHRRDLHNAAEEFDWGGPTQAALQLAVAVLALVLDDDTAATNAAGPFATWVISNLRLPGWTMSSDQVRDWFKRWEAGDRQLCLGYPYLPSLLGDEP